MTEQPAPIVMHGARRAITGGFPQIEKQVSSLENTIHDNPGLAFDLAKTLVESVCRRILVLKRGSYDKDADLPQTFKTAVRLLPMLPPAAAGDRAARDGVERTVSALHATIQGICELRNHCGFASHGAAEERAPLEAAQAMLAAQAADAIIGFLHHLIVQDERIVEEKAKSYDANADFNSMLDDEIGEIKIKDAVLRASQVLYVMEPQTYQLYLSEFLVSDGDLVEGA